MLSGWWWIVCLSGSNRGSAVAANSQLSYHILGDLSDKVRIESRGISSVESGGYCLVDGSLLVVEPYVFG